MKYLTFACKIIVKKRKFNSELAEVLCVLGEMEKAAGECSEERDMNRRKFEWEMEERRRESERKYEERMQMMMVSFMRELSKPSWISGSYPAQRQSSSHPYYMYSGYNAPMEDDVHDHDPCI